MTAVTGMAAKSIAASLDFNEGNGVLREALGEEGLETGSKAVRSFTGDIVVGDGLAVSRSLSSCMSSSSASSSTSNTCEAGLASVRPDCTGGCCLALGVDGVNRSGDWERREEAGVEGIIRLEICTVLRLIS